MSRKRRRFTAEQKAQIVRRHVAGKEPVSKLAECRIVGIRLRDHNTSGYNWPTHRCDYQKVQ